MSTVPETPPPPPPPQLPPAQRSGCLTALMVIAGLIMLLPGLCAIIFGVGSLTGSIDPIVTVLVMLGLFVGFLGIMLIRAAVGGRELFK
ncbi:MAG TPA: hypothetical protein VK734_10210 [Bradyrhizobium sp.]|jgi:hypothetical protein|nr:hypothetical protein [Bradyrhizobium sp.]